MGGIAHGGAGVILCGDAAAFGVPGGAVWIRHLFDTSEMVESVDASMGVGRGKHAPWRPDACVCALVVHGDNKPTAVVMRAKGRGNKPALLCE